MNCSYPYLDKAVEKVVMIIKTINAAFSNSFNSTQLAQKKDILVTLKLLAPAFVYFG